MPACGVPKSCNHVLDLEKIKNLPLLDILLVEFKAPCLTPIHSLIRASRIFLR